MWDIDQSEGKTRIIKNKLQMYKQVIAIAAVFGSIEAVSINNKGYSAEECSLYEKFIDDYYDVCCHAHSFSTLWHGAACSILKFDCHKECSTIQTSSSSDTVDILKSKIDD